MSFARNTTFYDFRMDETRCYIPKRYILTALSFIGMLNVYAMRVNLSVAMVAMVNNTKDDTINNTFVECSNLLSRNQTSGTEKYVGEQYNWDAEEQGLILGAFFYGYIITQVPGGYLSEKIGAKWLFGGGVMVTAALSLLTPVAANWGVIPFVVVRVFEGLGEGVTFPAMNTIISRWSPKLERSRLSTIIFTGAQIGNVVSMPISGWLSSSQVLGGWPSAFYVFGTISCIWFLFWIFLVYDTPAVHPSISKNELKFYETDAEEPCKKNTITPWKAIFTSCPMWALVVAHFGHNFGFLIFLTELPTYLSTILHFDVTDNGMLSALPYIVQAATACVASYIADRLRKSNVMSITNIRKLCNSIGLFGPAICLLGVTVSGCRPELIVALFCLAMALNGFVYSGFNVTHVDMSPAFAGTMYAITNTVANFCGVIGPGIVGAFTDSGVTIAHWSSVFYITAATYVVGAIVFAFFGSAELQPWSEGEDISLKESALKEDNDVNDIY